MSETKIEWIIQMKRKGRFKGTVDLMFQDESSAQKELAYRIRAYRTYKSQLIKRTTVTTEEVVK